MPNTAYSLWRANGYQQGFRSVVSFGFSGQKSASKPPQAICKPLAVRQKDAVQDMIEFVKKISKLLDNLNVDYLIVGGVALMLYNEKTKTKDLDIAIRKTDENLQRFESIISDNKLLNEFRDNKIIRIVGKPFSIDFHPMLDGVDENLIFKNYSLISVDDSKLKVINHLDLKRNLETVKNKINGIIRTQI